MPVTESKIKEGTLTLGGVDHSCQPINVRITPGYNEEGDRVETLCGDTLSPDTTRNDTLNITAVQDFTDPAGLIAYSWEHDLEKVPFVWMPTGAGGMGYSGTVEIRAIEVGGDIAKRNTSEVAWAVDGAATVIPAA